MEAAIRGILVLLAAGGAKNEIPHGGVGPVVGYVDNDCVARAAVCAVGEGILKATIRGIEQFRSAVGAGSEIGEHVDGFSCIRIAGMNFETSRAFSGQPD